MPHVPYLSVVGSLMFAMVSSKLDIALAVGVVILFMENLDKEHWKDVKWVIKYLRGTLDVVICYK